MCPHSAPVLLCILSVVALRAVCSLLARRMSSRSTCACMPIAADTLYLRKLKEGTLNKAGIIQEGSIYPPPPPPLLTTNILIREKYISSNESNIFQVLSGGNDS